MSPPPGGPPDAVAPMLVATRPDSVASYPGFEGSAEFIFDETVSEGGQPNLGTGGGDLERLILLSPDSGVPRVRWERSRIAVRPRDGWRPNTVYRVELLPGVTDLRRNRDRRGQVITFTTGAPLPTDTLTGRVIDWTNRQVARQVMVEALLLPDSVPYRTQTDSVGRFVLGPLPHGAYRLQAFADQDRDRFRDVRELWDTVGVAPAPRADAVLWIAPRDTVGPRVASVTARDTLTLEIQVNQPLDPAQRLDSTNVRLLRLPDSIAVPVLSFRAKGVDDSLVARERVVADSLRADSIQRAHPDTGRAAVPAARPAPPAARPQRGMPAPDSTLIRLLQSRPALGDRIVLRVATPLQYETNYVVEIRDVRNLNGVAGRAVGGLKTSAPPPPPKAPADSASADSTAPRPRP